MLKDTALTEAIIYYTTLLTKDDKNIAFTFLLKRNSTFCIILRNY